MPFPQPQKTTISHPTVGVHPHISDGSSGVLIDYGSFTVNQNNIKYTFDENDGINQYDSFYVYVWHMDVHPSGYAWIRFYYGDDDFDEFKHKGNGSRQFYLKNEGIWSPWLGTGDATGYLPRMDINREYYFRGIRSAGTSTWEFVNREPGLTKIVFMDQADWGGMRGIFILNYENLETPPGGGGGGNGTPILENPYYLNEYVYRQSTLGLNGGSVDHTNKIPAWSNIVQNTKTRVRNTAASHDNRDYFTYFYDGYISFPVNTRKHFGLASDDDSFMWIVEGDRLWSTVGHYHLYPASSLSDLIEQTGDNNNVVFFIDDPDQHAFPGSFKDNRTGHFDFEANKLYTILMKITEHGGGAGLYWGISDNSLQNVGQRIDNFPEYFATGYTLITINNPPITNPPTLEFSFYDNDPPFDFDFSSRFTDPDGDNLRYSIEYTSNYFTATIQDQNIAKINITPINSELMATVNSETIAVTATDTFGNVSEVDIITITVRAFNDPPIYTGNNILKYSEDSQDVYLDLNTVFDDPEVPAQSRHLYPLSFQVAPHDEGIINTQLYSDKLTLNFLDNKNGDTQLRITATDVGNESTTANIIVRVNPVNDKPYAIPSEYPFHRHGLTEIETEVRITINEQEDFKREYLIYLDTFIKDREDDSLNYNISIPSTNLQLFSGIIEGTNLLKLEFVENAYGNGEIEVTATDTDTSNPLSVKVKWIVNIEGVDDAPVTVDNPPNETIKVDEDSQNRTISVSNKFFHPDGKNLELSINNTNPFVSSATVDQVSGNVTITFKSNANTTQHGEAKVIVTATDNTGTSATYTINLEVSPKNDTPNIVVFIEDIEVNEDSVIPVINLNDYFGDIDNDNLYYIVNTVNVNTNNSDLVLPSLNDLDPSELTLELVKNQHGSADIRVNAGDRLPNEEGNPDRLSVILYFKIKVNPVNDAAKSFDYSLYSGISFPIHAGERIMEFRNIEDDDEIEEHRQYSFAIMENESQGYLSRRCMISGNYLIVKPGSSIFNLPLNNILYIEIRDGHLTIPYHGPDNPIIIHRYDFAKIPSATGAPLSLIPKNFLSL